MGTGGRKIWRWGNTHGHGGHDGEVPRLARGGHAGQERRGEPVRQPEQDGETEDGESTDWAGAQARAQAPAAAPLAHPRSRSVASALKLRPTPLRLRPPHLRSPAVSAVVAISTWGRACPAMQPLGALSSPCIQVARCGRKRGQ